MNEESASNIPLRPFAQCLFRNRSHERISSHSIESKSQKTIMSRLTDNVKSRKHMKSISICTDKLTEIKDKIETPAFSQRDTPKVEQQPASKMSNHHVYELLESIKIMPLKNAKRDIMLQAIRDGLGKLQEEPSVRPEIQSIQAILSRVESKLKNDPIESRITQPIINEISPIKKIVSPNQTTKVLCTNLNLQMLCQDSQTASKVNMDEVSNLDNIEYYKIMHMLGEKYQITPKKSERTSERKMQSSRNLKNSLNESVTISQLNLQLEMLENILQSKKKGIEKTSQSSRNVRDILNLRKKTVNKENMGLVQTRWARSRGKIFH